MTITQYPVVGLTCDHCARAVAEEVSALPEVSDVSVEVVSGGVSTVTVTSAGTLEESAVEAALDEAGDYHLAR